MPTVFQIDGLDSERAKWPEAARAYIRWCERNSGRVATLAVTDSDRVADRLEERYGVRIPAIPYGAELADPPDSGLCARLGVEPGRFVLFVGRLVPENNAHLLVRAHAESGVDWPLVIVGDAPYAREYTDALRAGAGPRVHFTGYLFGDGYAELVRRAGVMCVPTEVGGTHPVIVEGMAGGAPLLVSDHGPNLEVVGDTAATFPLGEGVPGLARELAALVGDPARRTRLGEAAADRARARFSWDVCTDRYLALIAAARERAGERGVSR
ncbi:MAG: glycosyltransferase family 4 protein [Thermoleophilia bacterium]